MKAKFFLAAAAVGVGLVSLVAPAAGAEEVPGLTYCGKMSPADEAYLDNPNLTQQQRDEAWKVNKPKYCVTQMVPAGESPLKAAEAVNLCLEREGFLEFTKAQVEQCIAQWRPGNAAIAHLRHAKRRHHTRRHHDARRHRIHQRTARI